VSQNLPNIYRVEKTALWLVEIARQGVQFSKSFSDRTYGGKRKALAAAREYRDGLYKIHGGPHGRPIPSPTDKPRLKGVNRFESPGDPSIVPYWKATWMGTDGRQHNRKFSVLRYGNSLARALAIAERQRQQINVKIQLGERVSAEERRLARANDDTIEKAETKTMLHRRTVRSVRNTSGAIGVSRLPEPNARWVASWTNEEGKWRQRMFSIRLYGEEKAKTMAIAERKLQMARLQEIVKGGTPVEPSRKKRNRKPSSAKKKPRR